MTILEASAEAYAKNMWFRPVAYRTLRKAFFWTESHECLAIQPTKSGGDPAVLPDPVLIMGEWETVYPAQVTSGR